MRYVIAIWIVISSFCSNAKAQDTEQAEPDSGLSKFFSNSSSEIERIRSEIREWDQSVMGFRRAHHFVLSTGYTRTTWHFKGFGNLVNERYETSGVFSKFQYSYHKSWYKGFGYFLGTSAGYQHDTSTDQNMEIASTALLPGVLVGLALNINPGVRFCLGLDYSLERWNKLRENDGEFENPTISVTARALDVLLAADLFYGLKWAVRIEGHYRRVNFLRPEDSSNYATNANISKTDQWYGLGLMYHLI